MQDSARGRGSYSKRRPTATSSSSRVLARGVLCLCNSPVVEFWVGRWFRGFWILVFSFVCPQGPQGRWTPARATSERQSRPWRTTAALGHFTSLRDAGGWLCAYTWSRSYMRTSTHPTIKVVSSFFPYLLVFLPLLVGAKSSYGHVSRPEAGGTVACNVNFAVVIWYYKSTTFPLVIDFIHHIYMYNNLIWCNELVICFLDAKEWECTLTCMLNFRMAIWLGWISPGLDDLCPCQTMFISIWFLCF